MSIFCAKALHYAHRFLDKPDISNKDINSLKILLENGYDYVNNKGPDGATLLYKAAEKKNAAMLRLLILHGADVNTTVFDERNPTTDLAIREARQKGSISFDYNSLIKTYLENRLYESTALESLCFLPALFKINEIKNRLECCEVLLENGALINRLNPIGEQRLYNIGVGNGTILLATYIISAGADGRSLTFGNTVWTRREWTEAIKSFMYESGFHMEGYSVPRTLKRQAANVFRKAMVPNAWVGLKHLPLPPGFDKDFIIVHAKQVVAACMKELHMIESGLSGNVL